MKEKKGDEDECQCEEGVFTEKGPLFHGKRGLPMRGLGGEEGVCGGGGGRRRSGVSFENPRGGGPGVSTRNLGVGGEKEAPFR